jgi:hypothetical protein
MASVTAREAAELRTAEALAAVEAASSEVVAAHRMRAEAEEAAAQVAIDRQAIESSIRHSQELVETALAERAAAETRAAALASELVTLRAAVVEALRDAANPAGGRAGRRGAASAAPLANLAGLMDAVDRPTTVAPAAVVESLESMEHTGSIPVISAFDAVSGDSPAPGVGAAQDAWIKSAWDQQAAVRKHVKTVPAADVADAPSGTGRARTIGSLQVSDEGMLVLPGGQRYDLYDRATIVRMQGKPGQRRWKVEVGDGRTQSTVDARLTDPDEFTRELARWRPELAN